MLRTSCEARAINYEPRLMFEIAKNFEQAAGQFSPIILACAGVAALLLGLFVWLGGLGFRRLLLVLAGAVAGFIWGFFLVGPNIMFAVLLAGLVAAVVVLFERIFIPVVAAGLVVVFAFAFLAEQYMAPGDSLKQVCMQMPAESRAIIAASGVTSIAAGFFFGRLTSAFCYAASGVVLIFAGMISILLYKGALPISSISSRPSFYAAVFAAMIVFGTVEQLLLCRYTKKKSAEKKPTNKNKEGE